MNAEDLRLAFEVFDAVCDLPEGERGRVLDRRCAGRPEVRARVERMLSQDAGAGESLGAMRRGAGIDVLSAVTDGAGDTPLRVGAYRIVREIGRGGMGVVYEAEQEQPKRIVAIKVLREMIAGRQAAQRFRREADLLARLQHPGVAQVYDAGTARVETTSGRAYHASYFAMELIRGVSLDDYARDHALDRRARIELMARVCDAVQHAHEQGVIHRDVKPDNILVDERGDPKVLDFGIARITDADVQTVTLKTEVGQLIGTAAYMSPEQLAGDPGAIDERTDVYSLGVVLYELLGERLPFDLRGKPLLEVARIVQHEDPSTLSTIDRSMRGDVETIVAKAIEKDPGRRYQSAAQMGEDLRRHLADVPIMARPPSRIYQIRKFATRHRALVGGVCATFLVLVAGLVSTGALLARATEERNIARAARDDAERARARTANVAGFQQRLLAGLDAKDVGEDIKDALRRELQSASGAGQGLQSTPYGESPLGRFDSMLESVNGANLGRQVLKGAIVDRAAELVAEDFTDDPLAEADIRFGLGDVIMGLGEYDAAVDQYQNATDIRRTVLGPDAEPTLAAELEWGWALLRARRFAEAEEPLRRVFDRSSRVDGRLDPRAITAARRLGQLYRETRRIDEAMEMQTISLESARASGDRMQACKSLNELGVLALDEGDAPKAMDYFEQLLEAAGGGDGESRELEITALNNVMAALFRGGRAAEAERYARRAIPAYAAEYGDEHPQAIMARNNLARVLLDLDRSGEAAELLEPQYALSVRVLPAESDVRQALATNLIDAFVALGRGADGESVARALLEVRRRSPSSNPVLVAQTLEQLGACLLSEGRGRDAEAAFRECASLREGVSSDHWLTHRARGEVGSALVAQGRFEEAEPLLLDSAAGIERRQGDIARNMRERELRAAKLRLVEMYAQWGKADLASAWEARAGASTVHGAGSQEAK